MYQNLQILRLAGAMANHAGTRQSVIAQNMANSDTPGYVAQDIVPFESLVKPDETAFAPRATRAGHMFGHRGLDDVRPMEREGELTDPNGNGVSLETEMMHAVDVKRDHDRALAIYRSAITVLRSSISSR